MKTTVLDLSRQLHMLRQEEIGHPTRIAAVEAGHKRLQITVVGYPWWQSPNSSGEKKVVFSFGGIEEGLLDVTTLLDMEYDEALEPLRISPLADEEWYTGRMSYDTYCSASLPEPLRLYALVEDYLWNINAPRSAHDYLNIPNGSIMGFCEIAKSSSFLVSTAPEHLHQIILAELSTQNVPFNVLAHDHPKTDKLFVEIGDAHFVCETATAEM
jgi:hypothetical protein